MIDVNISMHYATAANILFIFIFTLNLECFSFRKFMDKGGVNYAVTVSILISAITFMILGIGIK